MAAAAKDFFAAVLVLFAAGSAVEFAVEFAVGFSGGVAGPSPGCFVSQAEAARARIKKAEEDRVTSMVPQESTIAADRQEMFFQAGFVDFGSSCIARLE